MKCPNCRTRDLVVIEMRLRGERVVLRSCSGCDLRSWEGLEGEIALGAILSMAAGG